MSFRWSLLIFLILNVSYSQTRPTGGGGPDGFHQFRNDQPRELAVLISNRMEATFVSCHIKGFKPKNMTIVDVYHLLLQQYLFKTFDNMTSPDLGIHYSCGDKVKINDAKNENVACLIEGSELELDEFANNIKSQGYLENDLKLNKEEAQNLILFLQKLNAKSYLLNKKVK